MTAPYDNNVKELLDSSTATYVIFVGPSDEVTRIYFDYATREEHPTTGDDFLFLYRDGLDSAVAQTDPDYISEENLRKITRQE